MGIYDLSQNAYHFILGTVRKPVLKGNVVASHSTQLHFAGLPRADFNK